MNNIKLIDTGQTFAQAHPILNTLTSPIIIISAIIIIIAYFIVNIPFKDKEIPSYIKSIAIPIMLVVLMAIIYLFILCFTLIGKNHYQPEYTYQGDVKIVNVSPMDEEGKREVTIKCDGTMRLLKLYENHIDNVKKGDNATLEIKHRKYSLDDEFFEKNSNKPKKHVNINKMHNLEDAEIIKNK